MSIAHINVATAITPMALLETVMVKGYETLVDPDTKVDVKTGMIAACRLQALIDSRAGQPDMAHIMVQMNHIIEAVKSTVPRELWGEIVRKLDQLEQHSKALDGETEALDDADDPYDPTEFAGEDDEFCPPPTAWRHCIGCVRGTHDVKASRIGLRLRCPPRLACGWWTSATASDLG